MARAELRKGVLLILNFFLGVTFLFSNSAFAQKTTEGDPEKQNLRAPIKDNSLTPFNQRKNPLDLNEPDNIKGEFYYDTKTGNYIYKQKLGDTLNYRPENFMTFDEYMDYEFNNAIKDYWKSKVATQSEFQKGGKDLIPPIKVDNEIFARIFGSNTIDIRPSGSAELIFGVNHSKTENRNIPVRQRSITTFDFNQRIQVNVVGTIGEKLKLTTNYNTEATFDFENQIKVQYQGNEDEIIQSIDAGNVTFPLNSSLITGSQSLFGLKTKLKFGRLEVTSVFSQQRGKKSEIEVKGGAQVTNFEIKADRYEANKHYYLNHRFRDDYNTAMSSPPFIQSRINITKIEVWITNTSNVVENTRNFIAFQDLGESNPEKLYNSEGNGNITVSSPNSLPDNRVNSLYNDVANDANIRGFISSSPSLDARGFVARKDYAKVGLARKLNENEFYFNPQLGYISVNQELQPNQVLAVAYQYTYRGQTYQVGEFSTDINNSQAMILKMLKSSELDRKIPMWDLMMKNVYSLGAYQVERKDFKLDIWYLDRSKGVQTNFISDGAINGQPLIQVLGWDQLDQNNNATPDGVFDFLTAPSSTPFINPKNGRVYFPIVEPFGKGLRDAFGPNDQATANKYAFDSLYTNTPQDARVRFPEKNRFFIKGQYESASGSEISLNALNIPEGAVKVTAGGRELVENADYTVDYTIGKVKILNQGLLESGTPIKISVESNALFNIQQKTMIASRFDYKVNKKLTLGGTVMNLTERPLNQKPRAGEEPISNTVWGIDGRYSDEAPYLTRFVDKIPFLDTKEKSQITVSGEFAQLIPGHNRAIGSAGTAYVDDFEGSQSANSITGQGVWRLASTPQNQPSSFPEGRLIDNLASGYNRAKLAWYQIDPLFWQENGQNPVRDQTVMRSNHFMRQVQVDEVFPNKQLSNINNSIQTTFDLAYYPNERGPYNFDVDGLTPTGEKFGHGTNADGTLKNPQERWGGIQRRWDQQDFESNNYEYIQFWLMDPFNSDYEFQDNEGELLFNLGTVSEDVMRDGRVIFENGLQAPTADPTTDPTRSNWGRTTPGQRTVQGFDNNPDSRVYQDVGMDGLSSSEEQNFFSEFLTRLQGVVTDPTAYGAAQNDPSSDNFVNFRENSGTILERYKNINGLEGNSPLDGDAGSSPRPDAEDLNMDNVIEETESYWEYSVKLSKQDIDSANLGNNYLSDVVSSVVSVPDGTSGKSIKWYQFRIPIADGIPFGDIRDFRSIRFIRMYLKGFKNPVFLRFAKMELVRGEWRRYTGGLESPGEHIVQDESTEFTLGAVNIEENSEKNPVNYVLPPDIEREVNFGTTNQQQLNEQSLQMLLCDLKDGDARAAFRSYDGDFLSYNKIKMYVHANSRQGQPPLEDDELNLFVRLGTDFNENYYEYEIPIKVTEEGNYSASSRDSRLQVWPYANNVEIEFGDLKRAKTARNRAVSSNPSQFSKQKPYEFKSGKANITVRGAPTLNAIKTIMIGVRNPKQGSGGDSDDGLPKCAEVWVNELRLSDFDQNGGWAAITNVTANLADFATVSLSGSMSTPGWGSIDKKVSERQRETNQQVDASASVELGKFLGEKSGVKIPMYVGYSEFRSKPQFAPLEPDIEFDNYLVESYETEAKRDSVRKIQETRNIRRSINFTNVRKEKTNPQKKRRVYDISNFSATYSYSEDYKRDFNTEYDMTKNYRGGLTYNFQHSPKNYKPLRKVKFLNKSKYLHLFRDINFYLMPKQFSFTTEMSRMYNEKKMRNNFPGIVAEPRPFYNKTFDWTRNYNLRWDLSRALKLEFAANNRALIREPLGPVNKGFFPDEYDTWREEILDNIKGFGENTNYNHQTSLTYKLPLKKIPALSWISSNVRYTGTYDWRRGPFADVNDTLGHTIENSQQIQFRGSFNMTSLYNKSKYLREVNRKIKRLQNKKKTKKKDKEKKEEEDKKIEKPEEKIKDGKKDKDAKKKAREKRKEERKKKNKNRITITDRLAKGIMMIKSSSFNYSLNRGSGLPGFTDKARLLGMGHNFSAPGFPFVLGWQDYSGSPDFRATESSDFLSEAIRNDWVKKNENISNTFNTTFSERFSANMTIEPIRDLKIQLTGNWNKSRNYSTYSRYYDTLTLDGILYRDQFHRESAVESGNFSVSFLSISTAFVSDNSENINATFEEFSANREIVSNRLGELNSASVGFDSTNVYRKGYGAQHPDVLIPAFIAAYSGRDAGSVNLDALKTFPMPNWRITYTGLSKIPLLKKYFKSVSISHSYKSTFTVGNFVSNNNFRESAERNGLPSAFDPINQNTLVPKYEISTVSIRESFGPLVNVDLKWRNSILTRFEVKKDRTVTMSTTNASVTEVKGMEYVIGLGYTFKKLKLPFQKSKKKSKIQSDLRTRCDFSIRDNFTVQRNLDNPYNANNVTAGQKVLSLKLTADYSISSTVNIRFFFDRIVNTPRISLSYPTANTKAGISLRLTLAG